MDGRTTAIRALALGAALALFGCTGIIGDDHAGGTTTGTPCPGCDDPLTQEAALLETSRFPRLSHRQWENTIRDLFFLPGLTNISASFTGDPLGGAFDNNQSTLLVTPGLWGDYQLAAEELATAITSDADALSKIVPPGAAGSADGPRQFIEQFGRRVYRRPLEQSEIDRYLALFAKGKDLVDGPDDFTRGVRLALHAFLQSPHFVYRVEASSEPKEGLIPLSGHEIATKLSYMIWNTMPDDVLFVAAAAGELDKAEGILAQAERMLDDERAHAMVGSFHAQLYQYDHYEDLHKDAELFPDFTPDLGEDMRREVELFVDEVVFKKEGGVHELLTSPSTFVNDRLASLYGLEGDFTSEFVAVDLDPKERAGLLTRIGFLATNATFREQHSIHRGVFVNHRIACAHLPPPPDNVDGLPPAGDFKTNRERVEAHTGEGTCGESCHANLINPAGFAFENFDALGQFRAEENGYLVNAADKYPLSDQFIEFEDGVDFSRKLAESDQVHGCYASFWLEFAYGRDLQKKADKLALEELTASSRSGTKALILALTQTRAFRNRAPDGSTP